MRIKAHHKHRMGSCGHLEPKNTIIGRGMMLIVTCRENPIKESDFSLMALQSVLALMLALRNMCETDMN